MANRSQQRNLPKNFCFKPWNEIYSHFDTLGPCCVNYELHQGSFESYRDSPELKQIKKDFLEGKKPTSCSSCWLTEDSGFKSVRQLNVSSTKSITNISISLSNKCNFKCIMCNPTDSSAWSKDLQACSIRGLEPFFSNDGLKNIDWIIDFAKSKRIILTVLGGEPFISDEYVYLLDQIEKFNLYEKISLVVTTNLSVKKYKHIDHLRHLQRFPLVELYASFDGDYSVGEYIRTGFVYDKFLENFTHFDSIITNLSTTIQVLNIFNLPNVFSFAKNKNKQVRINFLMDPDYLSIHNLSYSDRNKVLFFYESVGFYEEEIIDSLKRDIFINKKEELRKYLKDLDLLWGRNLIDSIPELESII